ncbi:hypothetical protein GCM10011506_25910 [Marivirga lumbricoides]|uniref:Uncharacterized protein n=1 Tax=Marivirga lumbricoides TaxID=1046115 RepID=A0ABQ1MEJ8_9BACT|nr:hypothetical protein GCM10011506_25910 [Marivirga lumbricoides]
MSSAIFLPKNNNRKTEKGSIRATLFAYNHKTMNGNQPFTERFQPKPYTFNDTGIVAKVGRVVKIV